MLKRSGTFANRIPRARLAIGAAPVLRATMCLPFSRLRRGSVVDALESELSAYFSADYCKTMSSCRMALFCLLRGLGIRAGDEVLLTPMTIPDIVNAIHALGARPVFVDLVPEAQSVNLDDLKGKITRRTRAFLLTHLSGLVPDMDAIVSVTSEHGVALLEDISQSYGATYRGRRVGTFGIGAVGSFSIGKTITSLGGGMLLTCDAEIAADVESFCASELARPRRGFLLGQALAYLLVQAATSRIPFSLATYPLLRAVSRSGLDTTFEDRWTGRTASSRVDGRGYHKNPPLLRAAMPQAAHSWFSDLQARIARASLRALDADQRQLQRMARDLAEQLSPKARRQLGVGNDPERADACSRLPVRVPGGKQPLRKLLHRHGVDTSGYQLPICSELSAFSQFRCDTPGAHKIRDESLFIPLDRRFRRNEVNRLAFAINQYFETNQHQ